MQSSTASDASLLPDASASVEPEYTFQARNIFFYWLYDVSLQLIDTKPETTTSPKRDNNDLTPAALRCTDLKQLPSMTQEQFILFWKTIYELMTADAQRQQTSDADMQALFTALAKAGNEQVKMRKKTREQF